MHESADVPGTVPAAGAERRRWIERHDYVVAAASAVPAEDVYDVLADLETHLEWSGRLLGDRAERLLTIDAPVGPAVVGTAFRSTGYTSIGSFVDRSTVVVAERPTRFEFVTESRLERPNGSAIRSTWIHRFEIAARPNGSRIVRTDRQTAFYDPAPWWLRPFAWPLVAIIGYRLMAESTSRATLANLAHFAERRHALRHGAS
ncbi:MAG TPA: SRPBCC family protein [Candidatus Limnocylindrales bacterium]|nr:SRPBCC family protein [Candidatus Limnocylindrales bacterium]